MALSGSRARFVPERLTWPLVGRDEELKRIASAFEQDDVTGVVISGPAGVGKSRLARDAVAAAEADGAMVGWVQATGSAATVPLGAFAGLMPADVRSDDPLALLRRSAEALRERAGGRPIVLAVDDAHLLDLSSAALVLHLCVTRTAFVVATVRTGEPLPDAIRSLWKDAGALRLELRTLTDDETCTLLEAVLGGPVERSGCRWIFATSRGNVLYVRELLLGGLAQGALERIGGLWRLTWQPPLSESLTELITVRLARLAENSRGGLELLSLGEPLWLSEVLDAIGSEALTAAESDGLVAVEGPAADSEVRLMHPLYGEVMRRSMPMARGRELRLRLAGLVQARARRQPEDALRVARWLLDASESIPVELLVEASRAANLAGDPEFSARLAALALDAGGGAEASLLLARAHAVRGHYAEAERTLAEAEDGMATQETAGEYLEQRVAVLFWGLERPDDARALLARGGTWWSDAAWRARVRAMELHIETVQQGFHGSVEASTRLLADPALDEEVRRRVQHVHLPNLYYSGRAREAYDLSLRLRPSVPLHQSEEFTMMLCCIIPFETGYDWVGSREWMTSTLRDGVRASDYIAVGSAAVGLGWLSVLAGRFQDGVRWLTEGEAQFERHDNLGALRGTRLFQAAAAVATGDLGAAAAKLEQFRAADLGSSVLAKAHLARALAWLAVAGGNRPQAQRILLEAVSDVADMPIYAALVTYEALRAGAPARRLTASMERPRARCGAPLVQAYADHIAARAAADGAGLLRAAEAFAEIGALLYARESAADAAEAFAAGGRQDSARRAAVRSREWHALGQGGVAPVLEGVDVAAVELTPREAQLVDLAAQGLSNAEISDRLVLSVRTVESHLYRAMRKLGVSDRREL